MKSEFDPTPAERAEENRAKSNNQTILDSLAKIKYQSSRHLCINTGLSIDDVLTHVETDGRIFYKQVGEMTVYFLKENEPKGRLFNTGNNSFEVKSEDEKPAGKGGRQAKYNWTPQLLESLAASHFSYYKAAQSLGCDTTSLRYQVLKNKVNTDAWERGQKRFQPKTEKAAAAPVKESPKPEVEIVGIPVSVSVEPRFEHTLDHIASNGHSRESIEKVKAKLLDVPALDIPSLPKPEKKTTRPESIAEVSLSGGTLAVAFEGNLFQMNGRDRQLLNDIADLIQEFKEEI